MTTVAVLIPVLGRPGRVEPLLDSLYNSERDATLQARFLVTGDDAAEIRAIEVAGGDYAMAEVERRPGSYARKINVGARWAVEDGFDWIFHGSDDLCFCAGWADEAIREGERHGKAVVGTNDDANPVVKHGHHATHSLIRADYLERGTVDGEGLMHEGYDHNCCDVEFVQTAKQRGEWVFARAAVVEHLHPIFKDVARDATYELGQRRAREDLRLMQSRQHLWAQR